MFSLKVSCNHKRLAKLFVITCLLIAAMPAYSASKHSANYDKIIKRIEALNHSAYARSFQIGKSSTGKPIYAIALTNPETFNLRTKRLKAVIMAGQHGDEKTAVKAMISLASGLAKTTNKKYMSLLDKSLIIIIPAVNPDGFIRNRRVNGSGIDLNRDWGNFTQPETTSVIRFIKAFKPHMVIDLHEWTEWSPLRTNCIEAPGFGTEGNHKLSRILARECYADIPANTSVFNTTLYHSYRQSSLAHRYLISIGICSMLVETSPYWNQSIRSCAYQKLVISLLNKMASPDQTIMAYVDSLQKSNHNLSPSIASLYNQSNSTGMKVYPIVAALPFIVLCVLLLGFTYTRYRKNDLNPPTWSQLKRTYLGSLTITDTARLNAPTGKKLRIFREHRHRPTDRCVQKNSKSRENRRKQTTNSAPSKRICSSYTAAHLR